MLKILHTSDWHLGHVLYEHDRIDEQRYCMSQIIDAAIKQDPDAIVVSGDIFDRSTPSQAARELFINTLIELHHSLPGCPIVVMAGNHDGKWLIDNDGRMLQLGGITAVGQVWRKEDGSVDFDRHIVEVRRDGELKGYIVAVPHIYDNSYPQLTPNSPAEDRMSQFFDAIMEAVAQRNEQQVPVVLMAHLYIAGCDINGHEMIKYDNDDREVVGNCECVSQEMLGSGYDYLALGHIHRPQTLKDSSPKARYCGTPMPISFDENDHHGVSIVSIEKHGAEPVIEEVSFEPLRPLLTIPADAATFPAVQAELMGLDSNTDAYLRLNVLDDGFLPSDYRVLVKNALNGKQARFCTIKLKSVKSDNNDNKEASTNKVYTPEDMPSPLELAEICYEKKFSSSMDEELKKLFNEAYEEASCEKESKEI